MKKISLATKLALLIAVTLWASAFVGIRAALLSYSPGPLALLRFIAASLCMLIMYVLLDERRVIPWRDKIKILVIGAITLGGYHVALNYGEIAIKAAPASFIISQSPVITTVLAILFLKEKLKPLGLFGMLISMSGVILILLPHRAEMTWQIENFYILIAAFLGSVYSILQKPFLDKYHITEVTAYFMWGGTLGLLIYGPALSHEIEAASMNATLWSIYLGIFPAAIAALAWSYILKRMSATRAVNFLYFMPLITTLLGWSLLDELPGLFSLLGGLIALLGIWILNHSYKEFEPPLDW